MKAHTRFCGAAVPATVLALALAGALSSSPTAAVAAPASPAATADTAHYQVAPIVVTALAPSSVLTFTTDPRTPRQPVPASDGGDYLKTVPGFAAIRNGGTNGDPVLRGMFGSRVNMLTNGSCMLGACPGRMDAPSSYIAPETFDKLTVIKGPESVIWGPGASAGTVRFDRQPPAFTTPTMRVTSALTGGSWGRNDQLGDIAAGSGLGDFRVSANRSQQDDYRDGDGHVVPSRWSKWNVDGALGYTPTRSSRLEFDAGTGNGDARYAGRGMDGTQFRRRAYDVRARQEFAGVLQAVELHAGWYDANHVMDNFTLRTPDPMSMMPMPMTADVERRTFTSRVAATLRAPATVSLVAGLDQQDNLHLGRSAMGGDYQAVPFDEDAAFANFGGFAELRWTASPRVRWVGGARLDLASAEDRRTSTSGMMPMPNPTHGETRTATLPSGFGRLEFAARPNVSLYAGVGHSERFPDYWELFSPDQGPAGSANAFAAVQPERVTQADAGVQWNTSRTRAWLSAYAGRHVDYIQFDYMTGGMMGTATMARNILARTAGGEAGLEWTPIHALRCEGTLAYAWGENETDHQPLAQLPPLESKLSLAYDAGRDWTFGVLTRFVATQDRVAVDEGNVVGRDLGRTPGFGVLSLNLARRLPLGMTLAAGVDNVLDRTYSEHLNLSGDSAFGYPADPVRIHEPGRTAWLKLNLKS